MQGQYQGLSVANKVKCVGGGGAGQSWCAIMRLFSRGSSEAKRSAMRVRNPAKRPQRREFCVGFVTGREVVRSLMMKVMCTEVVQV